MRINRIINSYRIYLAGIFAILVLPLLNVPPLFAPAAWAGSMVFRIIFSILLFIFVKDILLKPGYFLEIKQKIKNIPKLVSIPFAVFVLLVILSTIFSLEPFFSFWGSPYRGDGSLNFLFYIFFGLFCYLIIKPNDWKKVWNCGIIVAIIGSLVAIAQQFQLINKDILISYTSRPPGTLGNPDFLATYLLLFCFLVFGFALKERALVKRVFYFGTLALFLFVIFLTFSRATYLGLMVGSAWFLLFFRFRSATFNKVKKIIAVVVISTIALSVIYINSGASLPNIFQKNSILKNFTSRLSLKTALQDGRISGWRIGIQGFKEKPFLGVGPENFSIIFDKHFNVNLPGIRNTFGGSWWDRAHNFVLDMGLTMGIPALLAYILTFAFVIFYLQKKKNKDPNNYLIYHLTQATFVGYFINLFFNFDTFATFLIFYFLVGFSLYLTSKESPEGSPEAKNINKLWLRKTMIFLLFFSLIWFVWQCNIIPLKVNSALNWTDYYLDPSRRSCDKAKSEIDKIIGINSYLDNYVGQRNIEVLRACIEDGNKTDQEKRKLISEMLPKIEPIIKIRPYYTRYWIYLGYFNNILSGGDSENQELKNRADFCFQKAEQLSPNRPEIYSEWGKSYLRIENYNAALNKFEQCIDKDLLVGDCWWYLGLTYLYLGNSEESEKNIQIAGERGTDIRNEAPLLRLAGIYIKLAENNPKYYSNIIQIYQTLVEPSLYPNNFQYHASLAFAYREVGEYKKAREEAIIVLSLSPESKQNVEAFLKTLPY